MYTYPPDDAFGFLDDEDEDEDGDFVDGGDCDEEVESSPESSPRTSPEPRDVVAGITVDGELEFNLGEALKDDLNDDDDGEGGTGEGEAEMEALDFLDDMLEMEYSDEK